jgi:hypothetical protein
LSEVASAAKAGDAKNDRAKLVSRFQGPALEQRIAYYSLRKLDANLPKLPTIAGKPITFTLPAATTLWPRTVMAVTDEDGDAIRELLRPLYAEKQSIALRDLHAEFSASDAAGDVAAMAIEWEYAA